MNQANHDGTDKMMAEGMVINGQIDTFWRQRQQDLLIDQMLGERQIEKLRMAPRFLAQAARRMELALTETGKIVGEAGL